MKSGFPPQVLGPRHCHCPSLVDGPTQPENGTASHAREQRGWAHPGDASRAARGGDDVLGAALMGSGDPSQERIVETSSGDRTGEQKELLRETDYILWGWKKSR